VVGGLGQERLADIAVEPFLFSPPFRRIRRRMDQADAQHCAGAGQPCIGERRVVIAIENLRQAAAGDRPAQQVLAGAGVLMSEEPPVGQQPGMVINDEEQPGPHRPVPSRIGNPRAHQDVGNPPLAGPGGLIPAVCLRLGGQRLAVQPGAAQLGADGALRHGDPMPVEQDRGDLRRGPARQLQPQRRGLGEQLRVGADRAGIGPGRGLERPQAALAPRPQPAVDRPPRIPGGPTRPGWVWARAAIWRASAPRSAAVSRSPAASAITAQRCSAISSCPLRSMRFSVHAGYGGTGGMKRRLPTIR
jgi:hypothetical protein